MRHERWTGWRLAACGLLALQLAGCESLQRKFTRKRSKDAAPNPIINFQDYSRAMTPEDRYRKHYLMFDYWSGDLMEALKKQPLNPKRVRLASTESLGELSTLHSLLTDEAARQLEPLLRERETLDRQLQAGTPNTAAANSLLRAVESQDRRMNRQFYWRDVKEHLQEAPPAAAH